MLRDRQRIGPLVLRTLVGLLLLTSVSLAQAIDPLPSWNEGPAKTTIIEFVKATTDPANPKFVSPDARIATFDQDGTTWVEQPMYAQVMYCLDRVAVLAEKKPELKSIEPFKTVLSGDREAMAKLPKEDLMKILAATLSGMTVEDLQHRSKVVDRSGETSPFQAAVHGSHLPADARSDAPLP